MLSDKMTIGTMLLFWGLHILIVSGALMNFIYPEVLWQIRYFADVEGGEPSEWYLFNCKIGGWVMLGISVLYPFIVLK